MAVQPSGKKKKTFLCCVVETGTKHAKGSPGTGKESALTVNVGGETRGTKLVGLVEKPENKRARLGGGCEKI